MFGFIKKAFFTELTILSSVILLKTTPFKCVSMTNQECKVRQQIVNVNSAKPLFYPFSINTINAVVAVTISMIHIQKCVFVIL